MSPDLGEVRPGGQREALTLGVEQEHRRHQTRLPIDDAAQRVEDGRQWRTGGDQLEDTPLADGKRWVRVAPVGASGSALLLARAVSASQQDAVGNQAGGRVFLFLESDDFERDYAHMKSQGVRFTEEPRHEAYGTVVVFLDLYGNKWDLIGRKPPA